MRSPRTIFWCFLFFMAGLWACTAPSPTPLPPAASFTATRTEISVQFTETPTLPATATPLPPTLTKTRAPRITATARPSATTIIQATPPALSRLLFLTTPYISGDDVLALQERLSSLGYDQVGEIDGIFGPMTLRAVKEFQNSHNLLVDGIVGEVTWQKLFDPKTQYQPGDLANGFGLTTTITCAYDRLWMNWMWYLAVTNPASANPTTSAKVFEDEDTLLLSGPWAAGGLVWTQETIGSFYHPDTGDFLVARDPVSHEIVTQWRILDLLFWEPTIVAMIKVNNYYWMVDHQGIFYIVSPNDPPYVVSQFYLEGKVHHLAEADGKIWAASHKGLYQLSTEDGEFLQLTDLMYSSLDNIDGELWASWMGEGLVRINLETGWSLDYYEFSEWIPSGCFDGQFYWYIDFNDAAIRKVELHP